MTDADSNTNRIKQCIVDKVGLGLKIYQDAEDYGIVEFLIHPLSYADTLIRIGYEPFSPIERRSLLSFYTPHLFLPGLVPYAQYLTSVEGFPGIFRCFWPCLARKYVTKGVYRGVQRLCPVREDPPGDTLLLSQGFTGENISIFLKDRSWDLLCKMAATIASHPFHVVAVRCMGQLIGREEAYKFPTVCIIEIFKTEGIQGFFSGLIPRLIGDIVYASTSAVVCISLMHSLQNLHGYVRPDILARLEKITPFCSNYIAVPYASQFYNVSDIMIVNGTSLPIGNPPYMTVYPSWIDSWNQLRRDKLFKTSHGLFSRLYHGPYITGTTGIRATGDNFGPAYFPKDGYRIPYLLKDYYAVLSSPTVASIKGGLETFKDTFISNQAIMSDSKYI